MLNHLHHENIILHVGKFSILGWALDTIRNDGFLQMYARYLCPQRWRKKQSNLIWKSVNLGSHSSLSHAMQYLYIKKLYNISNLHACISGNPRNCVDGFQNPVTLIVELYACTARESPPRKTSNNLII